MGRDLIYVHWILTALHTVKSENLQQITTRRQDAVLYGMLNIEEEFLQGWRDLDHFLTQFWTSRSTRLEFVDGTKHLKDLTPTLLPPEEASLT